MNLISKSVIKALLQRHGIRPSKRLGQNFLIDKEILKKIIETAQLNPQDVVLEIGPGIGTLTQELAKKAKKVVAVEKDPKMCEIFRETMGSFENVEIVQGDILKLRFSNPKSEIRNPKQILNSKIQIPKPYKIVANLPYYIVSPVIRKFLECNEARPRYMVLMVQKEVAQRIVARPPDMSLLAVSVQFYAKPEIIAYVSKNSFWPRPKVDSAIIKISNIKNQNGTRSVLVPLFFKIVRAGFSQPRKQLINNLSRGLKIEKEKTKNWLLKNKIRPTQRAETLSIEDWIKLTEGL